jgi:hypothetical protein
MSEQYIGDGLYFSIIDGTSVKLRTPREGGDHFVILEPEVRRELLALLECMEVEDDERQAQDPERM